MEVGSDKRKLRSGNTCHMNDVQIFRFGAQATGTVTVGRITFLAHTGMDTVGWTTFSHRPPH